jgi:prepilin-type N-terminal cleavage/methylation domain-containing protein
MTIMSPRSFPRMPISPRRRRARRGFTLTELAITVGIMGLLLGAIWIAGGTVSENNKVQTAQQEIAFIINNYRSLFGERGVDTSGDAAGPGDITCSTTTINGWADKFFPPNMALGSGTCVSGTTQTYPLNPWGGYVSIQAVKSQGVRISMGNIPLDACIRLASEVPTSADVIYVTINESVQYNNPMYGAGSVMPISAATATATCGKAAAHEVSILFKVP